MKAKQKIILSGILLSLLFNIISVYAPEEAVKLGDTFYAGDLSSEDYIKIREFVTNDKIDFLVGGTGYSFTVQSNNPESLELKLQTGETLTVNVGTEAELALPGGSSVFVKFLEYARLGSKADIRTEGGGQGTSSTGTSTGEDTGETGADVTSEETATETATGTEEETTEATDTVEETTATEPAGSRSGSFGNWFVILVVVVLIVVVGLIVYFSTKKES